MGGFGSPPLCFVRAVCFRWAIQYFASLHGTLDSQVCDRPYGTEQNKICRGDSRIARDVVRAIIRLRTNERLSLNLGRAGAMFAKQTCHGAKRSMLASRRKVVRAIFRLQPMFAFTKSLPQWGKVAAEG